MSPLSHWSFLRFNIEKRDVLMENCRCRRRLAADARQGVRCSTPRDWLFS